jgi:hypothetical protein
MDNVFGQNRKPSNTAFAQQKLKAWQPILTPLPVIISFLIIGIVFIPVGVILLEASNSVKEWTSQAYEANCSIGSNCTITTGPLNMDPPIYVYYKLENFYQNHRRYVKSRNDDQLRGIEIKDLNLLSDCQPYASVNNSNDPNNFYLPCGLIARSMFNDTYVIRNSLGEAVPLSKNGIAWQSDLDVKFKNPPNGTPGKRVDNINDFTDPDFVVWMRTAGLPTFRKLWRVIDTKLVGDYTIEINNNYPVAIFGGKKYIVISTTSWLGGRNPFLGYAYIVIGALCVVLAAIFGIKHKVSGRMPGDTSYLEWAKT